jgi:hypothetical protein
MVDSARTRFPEDMTQANRWDDVFSMESYANEAVDRVKQYARDEPVTFALCAFGIGFVLGWRLKPW